MRKWLYVGLWVLMLQLLAFGGIAAETSDSQKAALSKKGAFVPEELIQEYALDPNDTSAPRRIISLSPNITEIIFAMGAGDRLVGVTDYCLYPPEAKKLPHCGGWSSTNYEMIRMLQPDLILSLGKSEQQEIFAEEYKIPFLTLDMDTIDDVLAGILKIGETLHSQEIANELASRMTSMMMQMKNEVDAWLGEAGLTDSKPRLKVFVVLGWSGGSSSVTTISREGFLAEALKIAGGMNVFDDVQGYYPQISMESIIERQPDVIIELRPQNADEPPVDIKSIIEKWDVYKGLPAVKNGKVIVLTDDFLLVPGPRIPEIIRTFRSALYPEKFPLENDCSDEDKNEDGK